MDNYLKPIMSEEDLKAYDYRLKTIKNQNAMNEYLLTHKGKLIKIEMAENNCCKFKTGKLLDVGQDYIVIKTGNTVISRVIPFCNIKCITFVHDNDRRKLNKC